MEEFPSGQRGQTVNLLRFASVVRIHPPPPGRSKFACSDFFIVKSFERGCGYEQDKVIGCGSIGPDSPGGTRPATSPRRAAPTTSIFSLRTETTGATSSPSARWRGRPLRRNGPFKRPYCSASPRTTAPTSCTTRTTHRLPLGVPPARRGGILGGSPPQGRTGQADFRHRDPVA